MSVLFRLLVKTPVSLSHIGGWTDSTGNLIDSISHLALLNMVFGSELGHVRMEGDLYIQRGQDAPHCL